MEAANAHHERMRAAFCRLQHSTLDMTGPLACMP